METIAGHGKTDRGDQKEQRGQKTMFDSRQASTHTDISLPSRRLGGATVLEWAGKGGVHCVSPAVCEGGCTCVSTTGSRWRRGGALFQGQDPRLHARLPPSTAGRMFLTYERRICRDGAAAAHTCLVLPLGVQPNSEPRAI